MKNQKKDKIFSSKFKMFSIVNAFRNNVHHEPMVSLGNSFELLRLVNQLGWRVILACFDGPITVTKRLQLTKNFAGYLLQMTKHHGAVYTVKYLKTCQLALAKRISNERIKSLNEIEPDLPLPRLTTSSLPRIIPLADRRSILSGNSASITRFWMTLFSIYKVIRVPGTLKLGTITDPSSADEKFLSRGGEYLKFLALRHSFRFDRKLLSKDFGLLMLQTASPSYSVSWLGIFRDVKQLTVLGLDIPMKRLFKVLGQEKLLAFFNLIQENNYPSFPDVKHHNGANSLGQLSLKDEAAGKIRVFALVDIWTQSALKPIHEMIFKFLRSLPNDGTFDQNASVLRCIEKVKVSGRSWCYDLSAATDRLPVELQQKILHPLIGKEASFLWKRLLVDRVYELSYRTPDGSLHDESLKYAVGQPMGALSSWGMLAVCHHLIVQLAYQHSIGKGHNFLHYTDYWFDKYELLGDDIVIFDEKVATAYLGLMKGFGVGINLKKSIVSNNASFEFAKVTYSLGHIVSAISWKMFISQNNNMGRVGILFHLLSKRKVKHPIKYLKNILRRSTWDLGDYNFNIIAFLSMLANSGLMAYRDLLNTLVVPSRKWKRDIKGAIHFLNTKYVESLIVALVNKTTIPVRSSELVEQIGYNDLPWHKAELFKQIYHFKVKMGDKTWMCRSLADRMVELLIPGAIPDKHKVVNILAVPDLTLEQAKYYQNYLLVLSLAENLLGDLDWLENFDREAIHLDIEELILMNEKLDRLKESLNIVKQTTDKLSGLSKNRLLVRSPLKVLKFILKSNKHRPLWTHNTSTNTGFLRYFNNIIWKKYL